MRLPADWPVKPDGSRWTDEQWAAIVADGSDLLVAAAAGSGKTAVLVERIISRIADESKPLDVDAMLVATFTKAAAAEMKERIRHALEEALDRDPESKHLRRQIALLPRASVTTLHSFCKEIVDRYAPLIGLDPGFRLANVTETDLLRMDTLDELFEETYGQEGEGGPLSELADRFGGERSDEPLHRLVLDLHEFAGSHPWPEYWLGKMADRFEEADAESLPETPWIESLKADATLLVQGILHLLRSALRIAHSPGGPDPYIEALLADSESLRRVADALDRGNWEDWQAAVASVSFGRLKPCKGDEYEPELIERVKGLRDAAKKAAAKLAEEWLVRSPEQYAEELRALAPGMKRLAALTVEFGRRFELAKRDKGLLDFGDLEHYALRILRDPSSTPEKSSPSAAAAAFRDRFAEIYLDEYQDTNEVQEAIVSLIARSKPGNVFMVGDVKQSIYRFRLAEPGLFMAKYKTYDVLDSAAGERAEPAEGLRIDLARNFRSRKEIVNAVNHVFRLVMREPVGEMNYDDRAQLVFGEGYPDAPEGGGPNPYAVELLLLDSAGQVETESGDSAVEAGPEVGETGADGDQAGDGTGEPEDAETSQLEARAIAAEIRELIGLGVKDGESAVPFAVYDGKSKLHRPAQFRDIVILLRAVSSQAPVYLEELKAAGIPAYADLATGYFAATEVDVMLSLLAVIDNPHQDIPLAGVLRSPIGGFSAEQLAQIRLSVRKGSFWEAVVAGAENAASPELRESLAAFVAKAEGWRDFARREPLGDLLWMLFRETGYYDFVGGLPGGGQRQANLRALVDRATQYERSSRFRGLFRFLRFLGRMRDTGADLGAARALGESENVVRIVSIHRSKGLEFPIVFAAGLGRGFNRRDLNGLFLKHKKLGFGPKMIETDTRVAYPTLPQLAIRRKLAAEMLAEEMRVLYVALTRPKEKLYLVGTSKDAAKQWEQWRETASMADNGLPDHATASANKYLDWLGPAAVLASEESDSDRRWAIRVVPASVYARSQATPESPETGAELLWNAVRSLEAVDAPPSKFADEVSRMLSWQYEYEASSQVAAKSSITALKKLRESAHAGRSAEVALEPVEGAGREADEGWTSEGTDAPAQTFRLRRPRFLSGRSLTPAERGTAFHSVMQHLPIVPGTGEADVSALLDALADKRILSAEQRAGVVAADIAAFCRSSLYGRMCESESLWREIPFTYGMPAGEVYGKSLGLGEDETVVIQGVVDCLFAESDGLVLVDYKSDYLGGASAAEAAEKHRFQVERYADAVSRIYGRKVKEAYVYFFDGGEAVRLI